MDTATHASNAHVAAMSMNSTTIAAATASRPKPIARRTAVERRRPCTAVEATPNMQNAAPNDIGTATTKVRVRKVSNASADCAA